MFLCVYILTASWGRYGGLNPRRAKFPYIHTYIYIHIYTYIHTYIHIYIYIYIYIFLFMSKFYAHSIPKSVIVRPINTLSFTLQTSKLINLVTNVGFLLQQHLDIWSAIHAYSNLVNINVITLISHLEKGLKVYWLIDNI